MRGGPNNTYRRNEVRRMILLGLKAPVISEVTGCADDYVYRMVRKERLPYHVRSGPPGQKLNREEIFSMRDAGMTYKQIAEKLNCNPGTVRHIVGEEMGMRKDSPDMYRDRVVELHNRGIGYVRISTLLGIPYTWVLQIANKAGLKESTRGAKQLIDRKRVVELYNSGYGNADIAKLMFCSKDSVTRILRAEGIETCERRKSKLTMQQIAEDILKDM